jgi:hypothetical protein
LTPDQPVAREEIDNQVGTGVEYDPEADEPDVISPHDPKLIRADAEKKAARRLRAGMLDLAGFPRLITSLTWVTRSA